MSQPALNLHSDAEAQRRGRILGAAERAFAREGFHAATMQHVGGEAGMSAGNPCRTVPSKVALVSGLTERDRAAMAGDFRRWPQRRTFSRRSAPCSSSIGRKSRSSGPSIIEVWAEAARNPMFAGRSAVALVVGVFLAALTGPCGPIARASQPWRADP